MLLDDAGDYVALGEDTEHKRQLLAGAVSAWNIASLPPGQRRAALGKFMREYKRIDAAKTQQDHRDVEDDMRLPIKKRRALYQAVATQIVGARLEEGRGQMHVETATLRTAP